MSLEIYSLLLTLGVFGLLAGSIILIFCKKLQNIFTPKIYFILITLISGSSIIGALIYEYGYYLDPCYYCWVERIFLFPLFLIAILSYFKKIENNIFMIGFFSLIGLAITLYHTGLQYSKIFFQSSIQTGCSLTGPSCIGTDGVEVFGFITIPALGVFTFLSILILSFIANKKLKN